MNEKETECFVGATEGTGDRPKKKVTGCRKGHAREAKSAKKAAKKKAPKAAKKKAGAAKKSAASPKRTGGGKKSPPKTNKKGKSSASASRGGKKVGKSKAVKPAASTSSTIASTPSSATPSGKRNKRLPEGVDFNALAPAKGYGVSRIDQPEKKNHGWYVRMGPNGDARVCRFFPDKKHGSRSRAYSAAVTFRDEEFAKLPDWFKVRGSRGTKKRGTPVKPAAKKKAA